MATYRYPLHSDVEVVEWSKKGKVKAIRRLSDGVIFSKGEYIEQGKIASFGVHNAMGRSVIYIQDELFSIDLFNALKYQPKQIKE